MMARELLASIQELKQQLLRLESEINARKEERTPFCLELKDTRNKLHNRLDYYERHKERFRKTLFDRVSAEKRIFEKIANYLKEGYDLGMWYRINSLGPGSDYYPSISKPFKYNGIHE